MQFHVLQWATLLFFHKEFVPSVLKSAPVSCRHDARHTADTADFSSSSLFDAFKIKRKRFLKNMLSTSRKLAVWCKSSGGTR